MPTDARSMPAPDHARAGDSISRDAEDIASIARALAHPARIHIIQLLLERETCIGCDIVDEVGLAQSTVSEHLRVLKAAGIVIGTIERPRVCYSLDPDRLVPLAGLLNAVFEKQDRGEPGGAICCPPETGAAARE